MCLLSAGVHIILVYYSLKTAHVLHASPRHVPMTPLTLAVSRWVEALPAAAGVRGPAARRDGRPHLLLPGRGRVREEHGGLPPLHRGRGHHHQHHGLRSHQDHRARPPPAPSTHYWVQQIFFITSQTNIFSCSCPRWSPVPASITRRSPGRRGRWSRLTWTRRPSPRTWRRRGWRWSAPPCRTSSSTWPPTRRGSSTCSTGRVSWIWRTTLTFRYNFLKSALKRNDHCRYALY